MSGHILRCHCQLISGLLLHGKSTSAGLAGILRGSGCKMAITSNSVIVAASAQVSSALGDEVIILQFEKGAYFGLNGVGKLVWSRIQSPCRVEEILGAIMREYEVSPDRCMEDLINLLQGLHQQGLVEIRDETAA
jgi:hypothetical protein